MKKRGNFVQENVGWILISLAFLAIIVLAISIFSGKMPDMVDGIKSIFKGR